MKPRELAASALILIAIGLALAKLVLGGPRDAGFGEFHDWWRTDSALLELDEDGRRASLRAQGNAAGAEVWTGILEVVREIRAEGEAGEVVHARGFDRNLLWYLHYDLHPLRVVGRFREEGGRAADKPDQSADLILTHRRNRDTLEWSRR